MPTTKGRIPEVPCKITNHIVSDCFRDSSSKSGILNFSIACEVHGSWKTLHLAGSCLLSWSTIKFRKASQQFSCCEADKSCCMWYKTCELGGKALGHIGTQAANSVTAKGKYSKHSVTGKVATCTTHLQPRSAQPFSQCPAIGLAHCLRPSQLWPNIHQKHTSTIFSPCSNNNFHKSG